MTPWAVFGSAACAWSDEKALGLLAETVQHPTFPDTTLQREKLVILDEIARKQSMARKVCDDALWASTAKSHPYALPIEGTPETIQKITRQQVLDYYKSLYTADNTTVVVVGDVNGQSTVEAIGKLFQDMPKTSKPPVIPAFVYPETGSERTISLTGKQGCLGIGFAGPPASEYVDVCAVDVLLAYMGYGYRSWMEENLVNKSRLATDAYSDFLTHRYPGLLSLSATGKNADLTEIKNRIIAGISEVIKDGIPDSELNQTKRSLLGQFAFQNGTFTGPSKN